MEYDSSTAKLFCNSVLTFQESNYMNLTSPII